MTTEKQEDGHPLDWDSPVNEPGDYVPPGDMVESYASDVGAVESKKSRTEMTRKPVLIDMSTVTPAPVKWLWPGRFALGRLSLLVGRPGVGKSFLTIDMAMRITTGHGWPDGSDCPTGSVLLISCEDDPADTIRPRLDAVGADTSKIRLLRGVDTIDQETGKTREVPFTLGDIPALENALEMMEDCKLVVIDPIGSYLGGSTDAHRDNEVRGVLAPVASLAEKYSVAVVIVAHTRKSSAQYADDMALGSRAFTGIVRTSWHLMEDRADKELRLFLPGKNNLAKAVPGLAYRIVTNEMVAIKVGQVVWEPGTVDKHADDVMAELNEQGKPGPDPDKQAEAEAWLETLLAVGPVSSSQVKDKVKGAPFSFRTVERAKASLGVTADYTEKGWFWSLPTDG